MSKISTALPAELAAQITALLEGQSRTDLRERARRLSEAFRARRSTGDAILSQADALAYALTRLPATYAAAVSVLARSRDETGLRPRRVLDVGCGLGAGAFAALEVWPDLEAVTLLDRSTEFLGLARRFAKASARPALAAARVIEADLAAPPADWGGPYDLAIISYALTELPDQTAEKTLDAVLACSSAIAVIEPGTPHDYARLMRLRSRLTTAGARVLLPCPHDRPCPLQAPDWCHFATRLARSRDHKLLKDADAPFEDEKYAYLVVATGEAIAAPTSGRVIRTPVARKYGIELSLCTGNGLVETLARRRDKSHYDQVRKIGWGDSVPVPSEDRQ